MLLQPPSPNGCDSDGQGSKSIKRRISFTPELPKGEYKLQCSLVALVSVRTVVLHDNICSLCVFHCLLLVFVVQGKTSKWLKTRRRRGGRICA